MPSEPTTLRGVMDQSVWYNDSFGVANDLILEQVPELVHPVATRTYAKMRTDPQLAAILKSYMLAITRANWTLDPAGAHDEVTQRIADDLGLPIKGVDDEPTGARRRNFTWAKHLRTALSLKFTYGFAPFAQAWTDGPDGWHLDVVQERMPQTIAGIQLNPDGTLASCTQDVLTNGTLTQPIRTANHELIWYVHEREGSNYFGRSLLREAYAPWLIKNEMLRVHATSIRKFGMGVPYIEDQAGATPQQSAENARWVQRLGASATAGGSVPNGATLKLAGMTGTVPDAVAFITMLDRYMTRYTMTSILDMATAERGNRSLGETVMDLMVYAQQAEAQTMADDGTEQIIVPLVDANYGENETCPRIDVGDVGADVEMTAQDVNWIGAFWDQLPPALRGYVLHRYGVAFEKSDIDPKPDPTTDPEGGVDA